MDGQMEEASRTPTERPIARGEGWSLSEFVCRLGPDDRPAEEQFGHATIAAVVEGTFQCRTQAGRALLYPGAFLLGNAGADFECAHEHDRGDRCVALHLDVALFEEIAATVAGSHRFRFKAAMMPANSRLARRVAELAISARTGSALAAEELAIGAAEAVVAAAADGATPRSSPLGREQRRIVAAFHHIERNADRPMALDELARVACMSKYHFLRTFRRVAGITPYQYILDVRMRRAAMAIGTTAAPISDIAYDAGFGDLSGFNNRFRSIFGVSPGKLRRRARSGEIGEKGRRR